MSILPPKTAASVISENASETTDIPFAMFGPAGVEALPSFQAAYPIVAPPVSPPLIPNPLPIDQPQLTRFQSFVLKTFEPFQKQPVVKAFDVALPYFPQGLDGLRIVQLSDLQCYEYISTDYWRQAILRIQALDPDMLIITGDIIHYGADYLKQTEDILKQLPLVKPDGSPIIRVACMGNHDYMDQGWEPGFFDEKAGSLAKDAIERAGFTVLVDSALPVFEDPLTGKKLWISAIDDYEHIEFLKGKSLVQSLDGTFKDVPPNSAHIMLSHNPHPDIVDYAAFHPEGKMPGLMLGGHAHGGQFSTTIPLLRQALDFLREKFVFGRFSNAYIDGAYRTGKSYVYVNPGLGSSIRAFNHNLAPLRFGSSPEIKVFDLKPAPDAQTELKPKRLQ